MPIRFNDVFYTYQANSPFKSEALRGVSLEIKEGSFTCVVGHTGSGKSTLVQQLNGLLIPTSGSVEVNGFIVQKKHKSLKNLHNLRKEVGIVFQFARYQLFEESIEQDVAFGPMNFGVKKEEALEIAHKCLKTVGIDESLFKRSPFEVSGGQRRRVAIAGILALQPKILVLDEPTAGLDPRGAAEILELFKSLNEKGTTIILVTHDINIVYQYADDVIVMNEGKIELHCSPEELFKEDVEKYSLETPLIQKTVNALLEKGMKINPAKIRNVHDLALEIARLKK